MASITSPKSSSQSVASSSTNPKPSSPLQPSVSDMIRHGYIPSTDALLSPSRVPSLPPPPIFRNPLYPTLKEMIAIDQAARDSKFSMPETHKKLQERVSNILSEAPFKFSDEWGTPDVKLTVGTKADAGDSAGFRVPMEVHSQVLAAKCQYFAEKLGRRGSYSVEILDCDDVVVYVEAVVLMYYDELRPELMGMEVSKILALLKIFSAITFDDGIRGCLEYLEAVPWSEDEEESVVSHLNDLKLDCSRTDAVLQRVMAEPSTSSRADEIFMKLSLGVLQANDNKARKTMKELMSRILGEDGDDDSMGELDITKDTLYHLCHKCLSSLTLNLSRAASLDEQGQDRGALIGEITRDADSLQWILGILIRRKVGEEFVQIWADQKEISFLHSKIPKMFRHEISKVTAELCISIGKRKILVPKEAKAALLSTWLEALYDDFGWLRASGRSFDSRLFEEGLGQTILTLPLPEQESVLLNWFDRFLNGGDDCPNIQGAFEIWWRRAFLNHYEFNSHLPITTCSIPN